MIFARIHGYLSMATPLLWMRQPDTFGVLGLALNACEERNGAARPRSSTRSASSSPAPATCGARCRTSRTSASADTVRLTFRLLHVADIVAVTPGA